MQQHRRPWGLGVQRTVAFNAIFAFTDTSTDCLQMLDTIVAKKTGYLTLEQGSRVGLLVNNLGGSTLLEAYVVLREALHHLTKRMQASSSLMASTHPHPARLELHNDILHPACQCKSIKHTLAMYLGLAVMGCAIGLQHTVAVICQLQALWPMPCAFCPMMLQLWQPPECSCGTVRFRKSPAVVAKFMPTFYRVSK